MLLHSPYDPRGAMRCISW